MQSISSIFYIILFVTLITILYIILSLEKFPIESSSKYDIQINAEMEIIKSELNENCLFLSFEQILNHSKHHRFAGNNIPKVVHYCYEDDKLPVQYLELIKNCTNLNYNSEVLFILWTDKTSYSFIKHFYPDKLKIYESYALSKGEKLKKHDVIRPFLLHKFGGIYMDLDTKCQKTFQETFDLEAKYYNKGNYSSCMTITDHEVKLQIMYGINSLTMNGFMACIPQHKLFDYLINSTQSVKENLHILNDTGPFFLNVIFNKFKVKFSKVFNETLYHVDIGSWQMFSPNLQNPGYLCTGNMTNIKTIHAHGCRRLNAFLANQTKQWDRAGVVHMFYGLGYSVNAYKIKKTKSVCVVYLMIRLGVITV